MTESTADSPPCGARDDRTIMPLVTLSAVGLTLTVWALAGLELARPSDPAAGAPAGAANLRGLLPYWTACGASWFVLTLLWRRLAQRPAAAITSWPSAVIAILAVAAVARIAVVMTHVPALSDDLHRYVLDGRNAVAGVNPYLPVPATRAAELEHGAAPRWAGETTLIACVNNGELPTIYLPTSQWVFRVAARIMPDATADPVVMGRWFRGVFVLLELGAIALILLALRRMERSPWWAVLYAWHPLALSEIAGAGHQDAIGLVGLVAALALAHRRFAWVAPLALAGLVKPVVVPLAAFILRGRPWRDWAVALGIGAAVSLVASVPFLRDDGGAVIGNLLGTAQRFSLKWAHFGSVYEPLLALVERFTPGWTNDPQERLVRVACLVALVGYGALRWWRGRDPWRDAGAVLLAMVLLSPTAHPWYLLWALVLVPVTRHRVTWVASLTLPWGYVALADPVEWTIPVWVMGMAYAPVYGVLLWDWWHGRGRDASADDMGHS